MRLLSFIVGLLMVSPGLMGQTRIASRFSIGYLYDGILLKEGQIENTPFVPVSKICYTAQAGLGVYRGKNYFGIEVSGTNLEYTLISARRYDGSGSLGNWDLAGSYTRYLVCNPHLRVGLGASLGVTKYDGYLGGGISQPERETNPQTGQVTYSAIAISTALQTPAGWVPVAKPTLRLEVPAGRHWFVSAELSYRAVLSRKLQMVNREGYKSFSTSEEAYEQLRLYAAEPASVLTSQRVPSHRARDTRPGVSLGVGYVL